MKSIIKSNIKLALFLALFACHNNVLDNPKLASNKTKNIVANFNGGEVSLQEVEFEIEKLIVKNDKLKGLSFDKLNQEQKEAVIKEVVIKKIAYKEAKKRNLDDDTEYQEALINFEAELLKQKLLVTLTKEAIAEKNLKKNYDELVAKLKNKKDIRISYIAVKTYKEAESIYQTLLKIPNNFSIMAKNKSLDRDIAKKGGDLGFVLEESLPIEIVNQIKTIKKGQISSPIQLNNGKFALVKFVDERPAEILPYETAKDALAQSLASKALEDFVTENIKRANIAIVVK